MKNFFRSTLICILALFLTHEWTKGQAVGDYRSTGDGNWSNRAIWQRLNALPNTWATPTVGQGYPGQFATPSIVTIQNGHNIDLDVSPANNLGSLTINGGNTISDITFNGTNSLTVNNTTTITSSSNNDYKRIIVDAGTFSTGSLVTNSGGNTQDAYVEISTGVVNVSGDITMNSASNLRNYILFTGDGVLNVGGNMSGGGITSNVGGGTDPTSGTVNYNGTNAQNVGAYPYYNLTISGGSTKTLLGSTSITNNLHLESGILSLGSAAYNLTIDDGATITGSFDNTHMIRCDGTGYVQRTSTTNAGYTMIYPVGTGTFYTPFEITSISSTVGAGAYIRVRAVTGVAPNANPTDLDKHWIILTNALTAINANASFTYINPDEVNGDQLKYTLNRYSGTAWVPPAGVSPDGSNPMTTTGTTVLTGTWTAKETTRTLYSYQSGDWGTATTWTTDPSGTLSISPAVPGATDRVVILNGRTITTAIARTVYSLQLNEGGILDIGSITGHDFGSVSGQGLLRLSTATFPGGTFTAFVSAGGGTVEYYNSAGFTFVQLEYNNLVLNLNTPALIATLTGNMTVNSNLTIGSGRLQVNDGTANSRTVNILGNVIVSANGSIRIGTGNANHRFIVGGDFTNDGTVRFTNQATPNYTAPPANGRADAVFNNSSKDQSILCNNTTDFYRIEIDKGVDQTYVLNIDANATTNFALFGPNDLQYYNPIAIGETVGSLTNDNALGLLAGTVRIGENIVIPCLATDNGNYGVYTIDEDAKIWIDGGSLTYNPANQFYSPVVYGGLRLTSSGSVLDLRNGENGLVLRVNAYISIEDGTFNGSCVRVSSRDETSTHRGTYFQSGGTVNLYGNTSTNFAATFILPYSTMGFNMTGGTLNILAPSTAAGSGNGFSLIITSDVNNAIVTGGQINITVPTGGNANLNTTVPLWNLTILGIGAGTSTITAYAGNGAGPTVPALALQPLTIYNDCIINGSKTFNCNNQNLFVGHDFIINTLAAYNPGTNITTFNGIGPQTFNAGGTITGNLQDLVLSSTSDLTLDGNNLTVDGSFTIGNGCTLRDNGRIISVYGNITNSGTHFKPVSGAGSIRLVGTAAQTITGNGSGVFNNLFLNKTGGSTTLTSNISITGELRLANTTARLNIGSYNLYFGADADVFDNITGTGKAFSSTRMIQTTGFASDGGVTKLFNSTNVFVFPYGFYNTSNTTYYYMPGSVRFSSAPATYGTVTSTPVNMRHPLAQGAANILTCYWKTTSNGFTGIPAGSVVHEYKYDPTPTNYFVPVPLNEPLYVPGVYLSSLSSWSFLNDVNLVDQGNNILTYNTANSADGEFSAGETTAFTAIPVRYSTGVNGDWDNTATWSSVSVGGPGGASVPTSNTIVIIGDDTHNHTVTVNQANRVAGSLFIANGSTLDLRQYQGHVFSSLPDKGVTGSGKLRIASSGYFPQADFGDFIGESGGTVEYYTIAAVGNITIPTLSSVTALQLSTYKNLILSPSAGYNITLPDRDLTIFGNLTITGAGTGANDGARTRNAGTPRTYTVNGNLNVTSGLLEYRNGVISTIKVLGDATIAGTAVFRVAAAGVVVNNVLELNGNLNVDGTFDMNNTGRVYTYFKGTNNASISGSGTIDFYNLFVDKGTNSTPILTLTSPITTGVTNPFLSLLNGTFRVDNSSITVTVTNAATNFTIPSTACLSVNSGIVQVVWEANGGTNNGDLLLSGKLEVLGGNMVIGNTNNNTNNDIEYAAAGSPEIFVDGGQLFVNGQIRRSTATTSGSLIYRQTNGSTIINGRNQLATRAKFEITNPGSIFNTTGGTLTIVRNGGTTYGDAYIRPDSSDVTGGTIQFGDNTSIASSDFTFSTTIPLWNITVGTSSINQNLDLSVLPLTIKNLLLVEGNSVFRANGLNIIFEGGLTNNNSSASSGIDQGGFQPGSIHQIVIFSGSGTQTITGNGANLTNFANLQVLSSGTVSLATSTNLQINGDLTLTSGTFATEGNFVYLLGDAENNATHTSTGLIGGLTFSGTSKQYISGNGLGVFGNVILNNSSDVNMIDNTQIDGRLALTNGRLYIDDYLLTFGINATVTGAYSATRMIMLNGALSDKGVKKLFPEGSSVLFRFPIGVAGKYTPVTYTVSANGALPGSITVTPVNGKHPATTDALSNELTYYWYVRSSGFSAPTITHTYIYNGADILPVEANYVCGKYDFETYTWSNLGDLVDEVTNTITLTNVNFIDGEYTAGELTNFGTVIPLYSRNNRPTNNWNDPQSWTTNSDGTDCSDANCTGGHAINAPNGNPVVILTGHTIVLNTNSAVAYSVEVNGNLDCGTTIYHSLGHVFGTGKIDLTSTASGIFVFPGGEFDTFFDTPNTTLEFKGTTNATLPLKPGNIYKPYQHVIFSGTGIKYMSAENMKIMGNMIIRSGTVLSNALYNKNLYILGDWTDENTLVDGFVPGTGMVYFQGVTPQDITLGRTEKFYTLVMDNPDGVDLNLSSPNTGIQISKYLYLTRGNIKSYVDRLVTLTNLSTGAIIGGSATSFVDGYLKKNISNGSSFSFPVGGGTRFGAIYISGTTGGTGYWTASCTNSDPNPTYPTATINLNSPITSVSDNEYWEIDRPIPAATARVRLRWDANSYPTYTSDAQLRSLLRVVEYESATTKWSERGNIVSGNATAGTVTTSSNVAQDDYIFTLGVIGISAAIADLTPVSICDNDEIASVSVNLTGTAPWSLTYRTTGGTTTNFTQTGISSSPYTIQLTGNDVGGSTGSPYTLSLVSVNDASSPGICNPATVEITVKQTYTPNILGTFAVGSDETRQYSTVANLGSTFSWSWVGATGGSFNTATSNPTDIAFDQGTGTFQLQVVETSSTGCTANDVQAIEVNLLPTPDIDPKTANVCINDIEVYTTPLVAGHEYNWTVVNGTCTTPNYNTWRAGGNSISVTWDLTGTGTISVDERITAQPTIIGSTSQNYEVYPMPLDRAVIADELSVCEGGSTNIIVLSSESGITYQLRNDADDSPVGLSKPGDLSDLSFPTGSLSVGTVTFNVLATNLGCQLEIPTPPLPSVTVYVLPTSDITGLATSSPSCDGELIQINIIFTGTPPFNFTMEDGQGNSWSETDINSPSGATYVYSIPLSSSIWLGAGTSTNYTFVITSATDANNCSVASPSGSAIIDVYKIPETGPQFHIPNNYGL